MGLESIKDYDFQEEQKHGILFYEAYTDKDWEKYGDNIALEQFGSEEWYKWTSEK